jgi:hypothetical protein
MAISVANNTTFAQIRKGAIALLEFILFSNAYIALCAVMLCHMTALVFHRKLPAFFLPFLFLATLSSYAFHWYLTPTTAEPTERNEWNKRHKSLLLVIGIGAALLSLAMLSQLLRYLPYFIPVVVATLLYTAPKIDYQPFRHLRRVAILKTTYLALVWTFVTAVLPALLDHSDWTSTLTVWTINRFLFIYCICFWFDYRDREEDKQSKWLTLVSRMSQQRAINVFYGIAGCFMLSLIILLAHGMPLGWILCLGIPMLVLAGSLRYMPIWRSDYWYYVYLDGLLMLPGLLYWMSWPAVF